MQLRSDYINHSPSQLYVFYSVIRDNVFVLPYRPPVWAEPGDKIGPGVYYIGEL